MSVPEATLDYLGYAMSIAGAPLATKAVTLKRADTGAVVASTTTDAAGQWRFDDLDPVPLYKAEISSGAGSAPQVALKTVHSGDMFSLYVREKLTASPAAIVSFPTPANVYIGGAPILANLAATYVNAAGDTMTGALILNSGPTIRGGSLYTGGVILQTPGGASPQGDAHIRVSGGDAQDYHGTVRLDASRVEFGPFAASYLTAQASGATMSGPLDVTGNLTVTGGLVGQNGLNITGVGVFSGAVSGASLFFSGQSTDARYARIASGSYTGTGVQNGHLATPFRPRLVTINGTGAGFTEAFVVIDDGTSSRTVSHDDLAPYHTHGFEIAVAVTATPSNGFLVNKNNTGYGNQTGCFYWWVAIG